ncbi:MAG: hypothetical protein IJE44_05590 [Clostridia bacterium]|nr:hypothetical protein [Clostridia bacterium]
MAGQKFRKRLFGFKKADVYDYIRELDDKFAQESREKDMEIAKITAEKEALYEKYDELQSKREIIVSVLERAHVDADKLREEAKNDILEMKKVAEAEIEDKKAEANREIELKRRALRNMYESETRKIEHLRNEVTELRRNSLESIQLFERELADIETKLGYRESSAAESIGEVQRGKGIEPFSGVKIPIKVIRRKTEAI